MLLLWWTMEGNKVCVWHVLRAKLACDACKAAKKQMWLMNLWKTLLLKVIESMPHINFVNFFAKKAWSQCPLSATLTTRIPGIKNKYCQSINPYLISISKNQHQRKNDIDWDWWKVIKAKKLWVWFLSIADSSQ